MAEQNKTEVAYKPEDSVYKRLARVKAELSTCDIPKSGHNKFAGYDYHELKDFMPYINELNDKHGIVDVVSIDKEFDKCFMEIVNADKPEDRITFIIPYEEAEMLAKGGAKSTVDAIQRMGSTITYNRRYLYMMGYGISESDAVDASAGKEKEVRKGSSGSKSKSSGSTSSKYKKADKQPTTKKTTSSDEEASKSQLNFLEKLQKQGKIPDNYRFGKKDDKGNYVIVDISKADASKAISEAQSGKKISWTMPTPDVAVPGYDDKKTKEKEEPDKQERPQETSAEDEPLPSAF